MKLTKLQRYTAYCIMLEELEQYCDGVYYHSPATFGFCYLVHELFAVEHEKYLEVFKDLVELQKFKPKGNDDENVYWFKQNYKGSQYTDRRIEIIKQCIEETHP